MWPKIAWNPRISSFSQVLANRNDFTVFRLILTSILRIFNGKVIDLFSQFAFIFFGILPYINENIYKIECCLNESTFLSAYVFSVYLTEL